MITKCVIKCLNNIKLARSQQISYFFWSKGPVIENSPYYECLEDFRYFHHLRSLLLVRKEKVLLSVSSSITHSHLVELSIMYKK